MLNKLYTTIMSHNLKERSDDEVARDRFLYEKEQHRLACEMEDDYVEPT